MNSKHVKAIGFNRTALSERRPFVIWITGLSGAGKTTTAVALAERLGAMGRQAYVLDGDQLRQGLCSDLGFCEASRAENLRRAAEVAHLMMDAGLIVIASFISPCGKERQKIRERFDGSRFVEVYLSTPLAVCEQRDPKGLYKKARQGLIRRFTGIDAPYQPPLQADITLDTAQLSVGASVNALINLLQHRRLIDAVQHCAVDPWPLAL